MMWFGESWGAPVCEEDTRVDVPVGEVCAACGHLVEDGHSGFLVASLEGPPRPWHRSCLFRSLGIGSMGRHLARSVVQIPDAGHVLLETLDGLRVEIPFSWFTASGTCAPNFDDMGIDDGGQTIRLGRYEADVDLAVREHMRRR